jgi:hypothetical protein
MFHLGGLIVFLMTVAMAVTYLAILRHFLREEEAKSEEAPAPKTRPRSRETPKRKEVPRQGRHSTVTA